MSHLVATRGENINGYMVVDRLGSGRYSTVYKATKDGTDVAIKVFRNVEETPRYLKNELSILRRIGNDNKNVVQYLGNFEHTRNDTVYPCIVMNLGMCSLQDLLDNCIDSNQVLVDSKQIFKGILAGLSELHAHGIVHTDIKPQNIVMRRDPKTLRSMATICDLGTSTHTDDLFSHSIGTIYYRAPELCTWRYDYGTPVDIWSAFVTFYELLTNELLFDPYETVSGDSLSMDSVDASTDSCTDSNATDSTSSYGDEDALQYSYLRKVDQLMGPPPHEFVKYAYNYYTRCGKLKHDVVLARDSSPLDIQDGLGDFMRLGLNYSPELRISAKNALQHAFLNHKI